MLNRKLILCLFWLAGIVTAVADDNQPVVLSAQPAEAAPATSARKSAGNVFCGFSGGMLVHIGYGFASNPEQLFRNGSLEASNLRQLPKDGVLLGVGGMARIHLLNHIRVGGEGYMSVMPLRSVGNIRMGWGGGLVDFYTTWLKFRPAVGLGIGGGSMSRTYVDKTIEAKNPDDPNDETVYNASYTKTPFFYLDPQISAEFLVSSKLSVMARIDYMLPFGNSKSGIAASMKNWSGFLAPSGPRLYIGFMFTH